MIMPNKISHKKQILVVDDEKSITQMLSLLLETRGYEVNIAGTGKEAIEKASGNNLDLILLDLVLPDLEGFEVCRRLKEEKSTHDIPIIILSQKLMYEDKVEGLYLGADDYLTKPFDYEELFARMEAVMRRHLLSNFEEEGSGTEKIIVELRRIIDEEQVVPFYQPIYSLKDMSLFGVEVLTRPRTQSILANPELLFRAALKFGLYPDLEMLSWRKALSPIASELKGVKVFLNCNPYLVEGPKFLKVKSIFEECLLSPNNVVLELTERSAISDFKAFYECLKHYKECGFRIAVDDVGGGYASLEAIVETHPEVVKIDRHIVGELKRDPFKKSIVKFIAAFCKENGIISVAEGIETQEDLQTVTDLGVDLGQGYYLYRPAPQFDLKLMKKSPASLK